MLEEITTWLMELVTEAFAAFWDLLTDMAVSIFSAVLKAVSEVVGSLPVPDFVQTGIGAMLAGIGPDLSWLLGAVGLPQAFGILGAGWAFRLVRKAVTLGQW